MQINSSASELWSTIFILVEIASHINLGRRPLLDGAEERKKKCSRILLEIEPDRALPALARFPLEQKWKICAKIHVFAQFAGKRARPRAPGPCAVPLSNKTGRKRQKITKSKIFLSRGRSGLCENFGLCCHFLANSMKRVSYVEGRVRAVTVLGPFRASESNTSNTSVTWE